jgi:putative endonuclease
MPWFVYMLQCSGDRFYTGITTNLERRFAEHVSGKGGHFTRSFPPSKMVYQEPCSGRGAASVREAAIKRMSHSDKNKLALTGHP